MYNLNGLGAIRMTFDYKEVEDSLHGVLCLNELKRAVFLISGHVSIK